MRTQHLLLAALVGLSLAPGLASADGRRLNDLPEQPAVRQRKLYVAKRFEIAPLFESTINAEYQHIIGGGLKLEYHVTSMLSFGVVGVGSAALHTKLVDRIVPTLPTQANKLKMEQGPDGKLNTADDVYVRDPSQEEFLDHLNAMPFHGAAYVSLSPWYGKLAAFSSAYVGFDFYFQAGVALAQLTSSCPADICSDKTPAGHMDPATGEMVPTDGNPNNDPPLNSGFRAGLYLGGGMHVFLNDFMALDLTVRDYMFSDNPSGADYDANQYVSNDGSKGYSGDARLINHLFFGVGVSVLLPASIKRTP